MPRVDDVHAGAFHQAEFPKPTGLVLTAPERNHGRRGASAAITQTTRLRCTRGTRDERLDYGEGDRRHDDGLVENDSQVHSRTIHRAFSLG